MINKEKEQKKEDCGPDNKGEKINEEKEKRSRMAGGYTGMMEGQIKGGRHGRMTEEERKGCCLKPANQIMMRRMRREEEERGRGG